MRIRGRKLLASSAVALTALAAAACSSAGSNSSPGAPSGAAAAASSAGAVDLSSVTLSIGDQKGTGAEAVLKAAGLLSQLPFHATWADFTSGPPMLEAMGTGSIDIGGVGDAPPVFAASGGEPIEIVGARKSNGDQDALVVPKGSAITSLAQLKGKKIAVAKGSSANYDLLTVLAAAGLSVKDVTVVALQPAQALAAFTSGAVDAWDVWPPYVQEITAQDGAKVLATGAKYGSPYSFEVASKAAVASPAKAAAIAAYLKILNEAYVWTATHPDQWAAAWGAAAGLPTSIMLAAAKVAGTTPIAIDQTVTSSEQNLVNQFYAAGLIPAKVDISGYITTQFNSTVSG